MSSCDVASVGPSVAMPPSPLTRGLFSGFAVALGMSVIAGFLSFLRGQPSGDFHAEWGALVFFCCAAGFIAPILPRRFAVNPALLVLPVVLAAVLALQAALGMYAYWQTPATWLGYLALATLAVVLGQGIRAAGWASEAVSRIAWALVIAAALNSGAQIVQAVHQVDAFSPFVVQMRGCRPYGNIGQANHAATLAWLGLASVLYLRGSRQMASPVALPMIAVLLVGAALTASRMNWLFLVATAAIIVLLPAWPGGSRRARLVTAAMLATGLLVASLSAARVLESLGPNCVSGLDRLADHGGAGIVIRLELWRQAINVWLSSPWIGVGAYGFGPAVYATESLDVHRPLDTYAHNAVLQILAEFGLVGACALLAVALTLVGWLVRGRGRLASPDALLLLLLATIAIHAMLEFPLWYAHFLVPFSLSIGLLVRPEWVRGVVGLPLRLPVMGVAAALLAMAGWLLHDYLMLDRLVWIEQQRQVLRAAPTEEVRAVIKQVAGEIRLFGDRSEMWVSLSEPVTKEDLQRKIDTADRQLRREMYPALIVRRTLLAILDGDEETARWHLRRLLGFFPADTDYLTGLLWQFVEGRPEEFAVLRPIIDEELARRPAVRF